MTSGIELRHEQYCVPIGMRAVGRELQAGHARLCDEIVAGKMVKVAHVQRVAHQHGFRAPPTKADRPCDEVGESQRATALTACEEGQQDRSTRPKVGRQFTQEGQSRATTGNVGVSPPANDGAVVTAEIGRNARRWRLPQGRVQTQIPQLALARHHFADALQWGEQALAILPQKAQIHGIIGDAYIELGRYDEAEAAFQTMVNLRPDLGSYSRISYLRELHGDVDGAIEAMRMAVESTSVGQESWLWTLTHLGNLYFNQGDVASAEKI